MSSSVMGEKSPAEVGIQNKLRERAASKPRDDDSEDARSGSSGSEGDAPRLTHSQLKRHNISLAKQPFWSFDSQNTT